MIQVGFLLLLCVAVVTANPPPAPPAPANPPCVIICKAATNFNATKFATSWYEVRKITSAPEREGQCETALYELNADKTLSVDLSWVDSAGNPQRLSGTAKTSGAKPTDAQLTVTFGKTAALYIIFYVNYDTMFGVYTCINQKAYVWVFAKTQEVQDGALKDLNKAMTDTGLDPNSLKVTPRALCQSTY